jgi:hypothetical protein
VHHCGACRSTNHKNPGHHSENRAFRRNALLARLLIL